jgi:hypothetical protein
LTTLLTGLIAFRVATTCLLLPIWRTVSDHSASTIMNSWWKVSKRGWAQRGQTSLTHSYKNLSPHMTSASITAVTMLRNSLSMYVGFVYNNFFSFLVLLTAHRRLISE